MDELEGLVPVVTESELLLAPEDNTQRAPASSVNQPLPITYMDEARSLYMKHYSGASKVFAEGWDHFRQNMYETKEHAFLRRTQPWWPCANSMEFELLSTLHQMDCSEAQIDKLLKTEFVRFFFF